MERKKKLNKELLVKYFGKEILGLNQKIIIQTLDRIFGAKNNWKETIEVSFLSKEMKKNYLLLLNERWKRIYN